MGLYLGCAAALTLLLSQKILDLDTAMGTVVEGMKEVIEPIIVLALAWPRAASSSRLDGAGHRPRRCSVGRPARLGLTRVDLHPVVRHLLRDRFQFRDDGHPVSLDRPVGLGVRRRRPALLTHCFGCVLGGSLFGNVFSPIADTTILTQLATRVPLTDHVRTAGPYAALVGGLCLLLGDLPVGLKAVGPLPAVGLIIGAQSLVLRLIPRDRARRLLVRACLQEGRVDGAGAVAAAAGACRSANAPHIS